MKPASKTANPQSKPCEWCKNWFGPNPKWPKNFKNAKFCSAQCLSAWKQRPRVYDPEIFWARVDRSAGSYACWPYTGYITPEGYGWAYTGIMRGQQTHGAHRQAWINTNGAIPKGLHVLHHCDNRRCCNPKHLFIGTPNDNTQDMVRKERHRHKLSADQVREIRRAFVRTHKNKSNIPALAQRYGVTKSTVRDVVLCLTWTHIS